MNVSLPISMYQNNLKGIFSLWQIWRDLAIQAPQVIFHRSINAMNSQITGTNHQGEFNKMWQEKLAAPGLAYQAMYLKGMQLGWQSYVQACKSIIQQFNQQWLGAGKDSHTSIQPYWTKFTSPTKAVEQSYKIAAAGLESVQQTTAHNLNRLRKHARHH